MAVKKSEGTWTSLERLIERSVESVSLNIVWTIFVPRFTPPEDRVKMKNIEPITNKHIDPISNSFRRGE